MRRAVLCALLLSSAFADEYDPVAPAAATVVVGRTRLTLLSPHLFRFEVSSANATAPVFDDRATTVVVNRRPNTIPAFSVARLNASAATVTTSALTITVVDAGGATDRVVSGGPPPGISLSVAFDGPTGPMTWTPPTGPSVDPLNLNGTYTALDCYTSPEDCNEMYEALMGPGLVSRSGWALLDETETARVLPAPDAPAGIPTWWDEARVRIDAYDIYFNGRGDSDHRASLSDWISILGRPAMLPRAAFGVWWSRYYPYDQQTIVTEVLQGYKNFSIPLNFVVFDSTFSARNGNATVVLLR